MTDMKNVFTETNTDKQIINPRDVGTNILYMSLKCPDN